MNHLATAAFWKLYDGLGPEQRTLADKSFALLKSNPKHPSIHFKNVSADLWSARVGLHYRALALRNGEDFTWFWIGTHSEYDRLVG